MEWIGSDGKGGGGVGGGGGQDRQVRCGQISLHYTSLSLNSGLDSTRQCNTVLHKNAKQSTKAKSAMQCDSIFQYFDVYCVVLQIHCSVALRGRRCSATSHCIAIWECIGTGRGVGRAE